MYQNESIHVIIGFKHDVACIVRSEALGGHSDTRLVHWLILVAPSCLRSHNARYIMLKSLRNAHYLTEIIWRHGTWFSLDKGLFNQEIAANLSSVRIGKNLMLVRRWIAHEDTMQITMILFVIIDNWLLIALGTLQGRHDERDGVPNHQPHDCLLKSLFRRRSKKASKLLSIDKFLIMA